MHLLKGYRLSDIKIPNDMPIPSDEEIESFEHKVRELYPSQCSYKRISTNAESNSTEKKGIS